MAQIESNIILYSTRCGWCVFKGHHGHLVTDGLVSISKKWREVKHKKLLLMNSGRKYFKVWTISNKTFHVSGNQVLLISLFTLCDSVKIYIKYMGE